MKYEMLQDVDIQGFSALRSEKGGANMLRTMRITLSNLGPSTLEKYNTNIDDI